MQPAALILENLAPRIDDYKSTGLEEIELKTSIRFYFFASKSLDIKVCKIKLSCKTCGKQSVK